MNSCRMPKSRNGPVVLLCILMIRVYQRWLSPLIGVSCRFEPSCSEYARQALEKHGVARGMRLTVRRLIRCQPGFAGGPDPVPEADYFELPVFPSAEDSHE